MNGKLIFLLSLFGLFMAFATVYFIPSNVEPYCWLVIFLICAYVIAAQTNGKYFLTGLCIGLLNSVWITAIHIILYNTYMANHPKEMEMMSKMPLPDHPQVMMLGTGLFAGLISGCVLGLFAIAASKVVKKKRVA